MPSDTGYGARRLAELLGEDPGTRPVPVSPSSLAQEAQAEIDPDVWDFVASGAGSGETVRENRRAFHRRRIVPRLGRDVSERDLSVELFGQELPVPLMLAPIGAQSLLHPDGELATARAAASVDVPMILSTVASTPIEAIADALGACRRWFQFYWVDDPAVVESLIGRAERAGCEAIVVTMDAPVSPWREATLDRGQISPPDRPLANFLTDPAVAARLDVDPEEDPDRALELFRSLRRRGNVTWSDLETVRELTDLPLLVKGVLDPDDATTAFERGADGIVVSNHGGRQVDGSIAALDALPDVVDAVDEVDADVPVLFDSGIRRGADVFKAIALGARAVLLGRPYLYGLALAGDAGVRVVVENVVADFDLTLGMAGYAAVEDVDRSALVPASGR